VPLTGADCFLRAFDDEIRRWHGANHLSQLVLRLGPGFDPAMLKRLVAEATRAQPILRAPIGRLFEVGPPVYRTAAASLSPLPRVHVEESQTPSDPDGAVPELFFQRLNRPMDLRRGELLRFDVVRHADGASDLAATWAHMLFDGAGSEHFLRWLDACYRGDQKVDRLPDPGELDAPTAPPGPLRERGRAAQEWKRWLDQLTAQPLRSPGGRLHRVRQALRYDVLRFSGRESQRITASAESRAGFLTPMLFYLAAAVRAHHAVFRMRNVDPGGYLVPLPVNVRPRGAAPAVFRTHVSLIWFRVPTETAEDFGAVLDALKEQRRAAIAAGRIEAGTHALDLARLAPCRLYAHLARRPLDGELCSFFFAYTGEFLSGMDRFLGAGLRGGFHAAPVPPSPGSCLATSLRGGRVQVTHVHQQGVFSDAERGRLHAQLRADLLA
jgi:hypothetical protein